MPPPTHIVMSPYRARRPHSWRSVVVSLATRAPERMPERDRAAVDVQTIGIDRQFAQAGEHLRGERLVQLHEIHLLEGEPALVRTFSMAGTGPMPNRSGSTPAVANATTRPSGSSPRAFAKTPTLITTTADAPSLVCAIAGRHAAGSRETPVSVWRAPPRRVAPGTFVAPRGRRPEPFRSANRPASIAATAR